MMLQVELGQTSLETALGVICHTDGPETADLTGPAVPSSGQGDCPICFGMASASAVIPSPEVFGDIRLPT